MMRIGAAITLALLLVPSISTAEQAGAPLPKGAVTRLGVRGVQSITSVRFQRDGKTLISVDKYALTNVWDLRTGEALQRQDGVPPTLEPPSPTVALSADRRTLAIASFEELRLRDVVTGAERVLTGKFGPSLGLRFSPDGKTIARGGWHNTVDLWDVDAGKRRFCLSGFGGLSDLIFSPDSRWLATGDYPQFGDHPGIRIWETATGKEIRHVPIPKRAKGFFPLSFSADCRMLAGWAMDVSSANGEEQVIAVWEAATGRERVRFPGLRKRLRVMAFSPDGRFLASGGEGQIVHLWDLFTGEKCQSFRGDQGKVTAIAFSADGKLLATGGQNRTILIWPVARRPAPPASTLSEQRQETLWADLAGTDAKRAFEALKTLSAAPDSAMALLRRHLHPVAAPDAERVQRWITELDSDTFAVRERAIKNLAELHEIIEPQLQQARRGRPSLELRRRVEELLAKLSEEPPNRVRLSRALEILEWLNTAESRRFLDELARGAPDAWLTREAKKGLERLQGRGAD